MNNTKKITTRTNIITITTICFKYFIPFTGTDILDKRKFESIIFFILLGYIIPVVVILKEVGFFLFILFIIFLVVEHTDNLWIFRIILLDFQRYFFL